jgi:MFS transporter, DHA1 family, tetracycline resistance protein
MKLKSTIAIAIITNFLAYLGMALPYPILAPLFLSDFSTIASGLPFSPLTALSFVLAAYPLGTLIGSPIIGKFSDEVGRKYAMIGTLLMAGLGNFAAWFSVVENQFWFLVFARFITGFAEGNVSVARAIVLDISETETAPQLMSYFNASGYSGYLIGPLLGGVLFFYGYSTPFVVAGLMCCVAAAIAVQFLTETHTVERRVNIPAVAVIGSKGLVTYLVGYFWLTSVINMYHEFFPVLLVQEWTASPIQIGICTILATCSMIISSVFFVTRLLRLFGILVSYAASSILLGVSLSAFALPNQLIYVYPLFVVFGFFLALFNVSSTLWFSRQYAMLPQGGLMGIISSVFFASNIAVGLVGAQLAHQSAKHLILGAFVLSVIGNGLTWMEISKKGTRQ